jgi:hypothetical protein
MRWRGDEESGQLVLPDRLAAVRRRHNHQYGAPMSTKGSRKQPAKITDRLIHSSLDQAFESVDFVARRDARRRKRDLAKQSRKRNRK